MFSSRNCCSKGMCREVGRTAKPSICYRLFHVWMPPAGQGDSAALLSRARVRSCARPLMQPGWLRAPMSYVVQAPNQTCALWLRGGCIGLACIRLAGLSTHRRFSTLALPAAVAGQLF